jgi:Mpv17 / PMP22 family
MTRLVLLTALLGSASALVGPARLSRPLVASRPAFKPLFVSTSDTQVAPVETTVQSALAAGNVTDLTLQTDLSAQPDLTTQLSIPENEQGFSYGDFAKRFPFANNIMIATAKTAAADLIAQTLIAQTPITQLDVPRSLLFCLFGAVYLGGFQYLYQVQIFKRLFNIDKFTSQSWPEKLRDGPGLRALAAQTILDLTVLTVVYLPTFYIFKASIFSGSLDPTVWFSTGIGQYTSHFAQDEWDLIRVWLPADLVCFSVPLYMRLPVRHVVSFVWTAYLSFARGGH